MGYVEKYQFTRRILMKTSNFLQTLGYYVKRFALIEIIVLALTGLICWFAGWRTLGGYANGLAWAGAALMIFGALSFFGGNVPLGNSRYNFGSTLSHQSTFERAQNVKLNREENLSVVTIAAIIGLITAIVGLVLKFFLA
jgi:hypothetical protein